VLLQDEGRRLRAADLQEHVPARPDVGRYRADRRPRLRPQRRVPPLRAAPPRLAPRVAGRDPAVAGDRDMLEIKNVGKIYGAGTTATHAIAEVSFDVSEGEFMCVVGPSGCGKTTLLKCISGLLRPTRGEVVLKGERGTAPPEEMALVFQEYGRSLMPWTSVRNNVLLPLRHRKLSRAQRASLVEESLAAVGLTEVIDHYPWQLSGGMQT